MRLLMAIAPAPPVRKPPAPKPPACLARGGRYCITITSKHANKATTNPVELWDLGRYPDEAKHHSGQSSLFKKTGVNIPSDGEDIEDTEEDED